VLLHFAPKPPKHTPLKEEKVTKSTKSATTAVKRIEGEGPPRDVPPSLLVEEEEKRTNAFFCLFPLGQEQWPSKLC